MSSKNSNYDVVYRGETRSHIRPGTYVFFQRLKEHGGGYWLGQAYDNWFGFVVERPVSLREGMTLLVMIGDQQKDADNMDAFVLKGE
ncbi:hypothetical protein CWS43_09660 [Rahnella sp. AA]|uniref:hypothetical protein n=1 Tax=Rahnella sp. AA TaxID=2057180 RepID=UPI000C31FCEE|nr:hypothetical protein [Rahnella sp. AA]PKE30939.1 hypothetical protein CWS43_09660 [Rahnella sp. AA]